MNFEFATAARIIYGSGTLGRIGDLASHLGNRALLLIYSHASEELRDRLETNLDHFGVDLVAYHVSGEPSLESIQAGLELLRATGCDFLISTGGGSVIDSGKAIAALAANPGDVLDYLEVIGAGKLLTQPSLPLIAIPTTAGTGAEVTRNAVIGSAMHGFKVSLRSPFMLPKIAIIDPQLTLSLPPEITASTGCDALCQLIESFLSNAANPISDALCREGLQTAAWALRRAFHAPEDLPARERMSLASLLSGMALANSKLGAVHGFASVIGGAYRAPHGAICARLLPLVMQVNLRALKLRQSASPALPRFREVAQILTGQPSAGEDDGVEWLFKLGDELHIPGLAGFGLQRQHFADLVQAARQASSMKGNPIELTDFELTGILEQSL